ncbi:MAG: hypothetical protein JRE24_02050 [Deltaproteobacteria bacterium]|nr:hypothetical protein [Deltaproteobacteria bacterium]
MSLLPIRLKSLVFLSATLSMFVGSCTTTTRFAGSGGPYHTETYKSVLDEWSREARIHNGLEVELIVAATFKSQQFRRAYADEYAKAYRLSPQREKRFVEDQLEAAARGHEFLIASFVPEQKWNDFDKARSMWQLYLVNDQNERVSPVEVGKVRREDAVTPHFFPYVTPWKSVYTVRFPYNILTTNEPIIEEDTQEIKLVITSVLGTAEMSWELK